MSGPLSNAHTVTKLPAQDLENTLADLRAGGWPSSASRCLALVPAVTRLPPLTDNYPSKGTGERGTFFFDSEGNLIGLAQATR